MRSTCDLTLKILHLSHGIASPSTTFDDIVAYRGTASLSDLMLDADIRSEEFHGLEVHRGLLRMYRASKSRDRLPVVGGYSCGGVLSLLHAIDATVKHHDPPETVVTIASPRFVRQTSLPQLSRLLHQTRIVRVANPRDIIVQSPPNFCHYETELLTIDSLSPPFRRNWLYEHLSTTYSLALENNSATCASSFGWSRTACSYDESEGENESRGLANM